MAVDIPGQMVLALNDPDEQGRWYPKVTNQLYFKFQQNNAGQVEKMILTQIAPIPRLPGQDTILPEIPGSLVPYIGTYDLPQARMKVKVSYMDGTLAIPDLLGRTRENLLLREENGKWTDRKRIFAPAQRLTGHRDGPFPLVLTEPHPPKKQSKT